MYAAHFGLNETAFSIAPDPRFLFMSATHREALAHLVYGLQAGGGIVLLTGEIGAGKTTLCRAFLAQLPAGCHVAYLYNPQLAQEELLQAVVEEFGAAPQPPLQEQGPGRGLKALVDTLQRHLLAAHGRGEQCLLVVDEAQGLDAGRLELLRLLTNLETPERKLLQVMLVGQPELAQRLAEPALRQLEQRIVARSHLAALLPAETAELVRHRLAVAGLAGPCPFDDAALRAVHRASAGIPRRVNRICERAMLAAYASGRQRIDAETVRRAAEEVDHGPLAGRPGAPGLASAKSVRKAALVGAAAATAVAGLAVALTWPTFRQSGAPGSAGSPARTQEAGGATAPAVAAAGSAPASATAGADAAPVAPSGPKSTDAVEAYASLEAAMSDLRALWGPEAASAACPTTVGLKVAFACHRGQADLELLQRLDRPVLLELTPEGWLLLLAIDDHSLTVRGAHGESRLARAALLPAWQGHFVTLWRPPMGAAGAAISVPGPAADWALDRLSALQGPLQGALARQPLDAQLRQRIFAFQHSQGLPLDAVAGPLTLMQLNRVSGVAEPRLRPAR